MMSNVYRRLFQLNKKTENRPRLFEGSLIKNKSVITYIKRSDLLEFYEQFFLIYVNKQFV